MTTANLSNELTSLLKKYIKSEGFYASGKLYKSISFIVTDSPSSGLKVELDSKEYINYIDGGKFLKKFFDLKSVGDLFAKYTEEKINEIINSFNI